MTPTSPGRPTAPARQFNAADRLLTAADQALRVLLADPQPARPYPAEGLGETVDDPAERRHVAGLMRVNHSGEIAAQALYQGQALVARSNVTRESLMEAGREEHDHLAWCARRVHELGERTSVLAPAWYAGSFAIGALAGLAGDRTSLGFVAETERQVVEHLEGHLRQLPREDTRSRAILEQMRSDETRHGHEAMNAGGALLPMIARTMMKLTARIMTRSSYWL